MSGLTAKAVQDFERGKRNSNFPTAVRIATIYGKTLSELLDSAPSLVHLSGSTGWRLRNARQRSGLSLVAVRKRTGISSSCLSLAETDKAYHSTERMIALSELYGVSVDDLVGDELESFTPPH